MNFFLSAVAVFVIVLGALINRTIASISEAPNTQETPATEVLSGRDEQPPEAQPKPTPTPEPPAPQPELQGEYIYQGASIVSRDPLVMRSNDAPEAISDWYESKIRAAGFDVKSFVRTNTNGNLLHKFAAEDGDGSSITVEIDRPSGEEVTKITVTK